MMDFFFQIRLEQVTDPLIAMLLALRNGSILVSQLGVQDAILDEKVILQSIDLSYFGIYILGTINTGISQAISNMQYVSYLIINISPLFPKLGKKKNSLVLYHP